MDDGKFLRIDSASIDCEECGDFNNGMYFRIYQDDIGEYIECRDCKKKLYVKLKKNCINCTGLEFVQADHVGDSGPCCNYRKYHTEKEEFKHIQMLDNQKYLLKSKVCCRLKEL